MPLRILAMFLALELSASAQEPGAQLLDRRVLDLPAPSEPPATLVATPLAPGPALSTTSNAGETAQRAPSAPGLLTLQNDRPRPNRLQLGLEVLGFYDDNIFGVSKGNRPGDFLWELTPAIGWNTAGLTGAEHAVQLLYAPTLVFYSQYSNNDTVNQNADFIYTFESGKTHLTVRQSVGSAQEANADFAGLTKSSTYTTLVDWNYQLAAKTSLQVTARQVVSTDDPGYDATEWTGATYLDYQALPKTSFGLGVLVGAADLPGPNQDFGQFNFRAIYDPTAKLSFNTILGAELRQTQGRSDTTLTPNFSLGAAWEPKEGTDFELNAYRRENYSGKFFAENFRATGVSGSLTQRLLDRYRFVLASAYEHAEYRDNLIGRETNQEYDYVSVRPAFSWQATDWCDLTVFYQHRESISETVAPFTDNQVGFSARFVY